MKFSIEFKTFISINQKRQLARSFHLLIDLNSPIVNCEEQFIGTKRKENGLFFSFIMYEDLPSHSSSIDAIALYGENCITSNFSRLFSSVGIDVYFISSKSDQISSLNPSFITTKTDLPYLSSVLINCQDDLIEMKQFLDLFPNDYKQRMAYVECSSYLRQNQLEEFYDQMKFSYYLCMNVIELDSSTMIQPNIQLICSGNEIVFQKLILQTNLPVKRTFLNHCQSPFDAFYVGLFHRYSQAMHLAIYAEMMAVFKAANPIYPGNFHSNTMD